MNATAAQVSLQRPPVLDSGPAAAPRPGM